MTRNGTITLSLLAVAIIAWLVLVDLRQQQPSKDGLIFHLNPEKISRILIADGNDSHLLQRKEGDWYISTTLPDRANADEIAHLLTIASELQPLNSLNPKELKNKLSLSSLGLQNPKRSLTFHQEGANDQTLFIGNEAVGEKSLFARMDHEKRVLIIPSTLADIAFHSSDDFRDLHLTTLKLKDLKEIIVTQGMSKLCLQKKNEPLPKIASVHEIAHEKAPAKGTTHIGADVDVQERSEQWEMTQPVLGMISSGALQAWMAPLLTTELTRTANDNTNLEVLSAYGLDPPRATISLLAEDSSEPIILSLGNIVEEKNRDSSTVYLRSSARQGIFKAPAYVIPLFMITPEALRDRQFLTLNLDTVDRITISTSGKKVSLHRQPGGSEDWALEDQTVIPKATLEKMVESLEKTKILSYQIATPSKAAVVGLDDSSTPTATIQFIAHLSENTPDDEAGDHTVMEVSFGKKIGTTIFARLKKDPELLEVPAETINFLNLK